MIDIKSVNPVALPSLPVALRKGLPVCSSIYFVLEEDKVVYIGRSANLNNRWKDHHRLCQLSENAVISWLELSDPRLLDDIESALIEYFHPILNGSNIVKNDDRMTRFSISVPDDLDEFIRDYSKKQRRSVSAQIQLLIEMLKNNEENE